MVAVRGDLRRRLGHVATTRITVPAERWQSEVISVGDLDGQHDCCRDRRKAEWQSEVISVGDLDTLVAHSDLSNHIGGSQR